MTNFLEIPHPCCRIDYRVLEEKESEKGSVCWTQVLMRFLVKQRVGKTQLRKL